MTFTACKHLSFDKEKFSIQLVQISDHLGWERFNPEGELQLCQQCTLRGRINDPQGCIGKDRAKCSEYEDREFSIKDLL